MKTSLFLRRGQLPTLGGHRHITRCRRPSRLGKSSSFLLLTLGERRHITQCESLSRPEKSPQRRRLPILGGHQRITQCGRLSRPGRSTSSDDKIRVGVWIVFGASCQRGRPWHLVWKDQHTKNSKGGRVKSRAGSRVGSQVQAVGGQASRRGARLWIGARCRLGRRSRNEWLVSGAQQVRCPTRLSQRHHCLCLVRLLLVWLPPLLARVCPLPR